MAVSMNMSFFWNTDDVMCSGRYLLIFQSLWPYIPESMALHSRVYGLTFQSLWPYIPESMALHSRTQLWSKLIKGLYKLACFTLLCLRSMLQIPTPLQYIPQVYFTHLGI